VLKSLNFARGVVRIAISLFRSLNFVSGAVRIAISLIILTLCKRHIDEVEQKVKPDTALLCLHDEDLRCIDCHE
jgi:hypothetical protein